MPSTLFFRLLDAEDKGTALQQAIAALPQNPTPEAFTVNPKSFERVPSATFAYWVTQKVLALFSKLPRLGHGERAIKVGLQSGDDFRFARSFWELGACELCNQSKYFPFAKGGKLSRFYQDFDLVINWEKDGGEVKNIQDDKGKIRSRPQNTAYYFLPGITWSDRTTSAFSARAWPTGGIFSVKGSSGFFGEEDNLPVLALMNSTLFNFFLSLMVGAADAAARSYQVGLISDVPYPKTDAFHFQKCWIEMGRLARTGWSLKRNLDTITQTSHAFILPALLQVQGATLANAPKPGQKPSPPPSKN